MPPKKKSAIPDRWTDYTAVGKRIPGTRFIAFKVPLKQSLRSQLPALEAFGPFDLVGILEKEGQELGLIIDLTFTTRYYSPEDLPHTLHHLKIFTAGHEVPNDATILSFKKAVRHFLRENADNDKLIGVHCTHGLNRTGYLVCRYLIDVEGMDPRKAINLFNASRGHSIERQNYLDDLSNGPRRTNTGIEKPDQEPIQGCASLNQHDFHPHQSDYDYHDGHFNSQRSHPWHGGHQHFVPFHQNDMWFRPPAQHPVRPPLFPTPPPGLRPMRPPFHSQSFRGGYCSSAFPYPPTQTHYKFRESQQDPCGLPLPSPSEEPMGPRGSNKKRRNRHHKKGRKDWTPCGNTGDFQ